MGKSSGRKIVVSKDGPYIVSGNVPLAIQIITPNKEGLSWDWKEGKTIETKEEYSLCRCGRSKTKPFCDGTHTKNQVRWNRDGDPAALHPTGRRVRGSNAHSERCRGSLRVRALLRSWRKNLEPYGTDR